MAHTAEDLADFSGDDSAAVRRVLERLASRDVWILRRVEAAAGEEGSEGSYEIYHDTLGERDIGLLPGRRGIVHRR